MLTLLDVQKIIDQNWQVVKQEQGLYGLEKKLIGSVGASNWCIEYRATMYTPVMKKYTNNINLALKWYNNGFNE